MPYEELSALATAIGEAARRLEQTQALPGHPESSMWYEEFIIYAIYSKMNTCTIYFHV